MSFLKKTFEKAANIRVKAEMAAYSINVFAQQQKGTLDPCAIDSDPRAIREAESRPRIAETKKERDAFYKKAMKGKQYIFFGDNNHSDTRIPDYFFGGDNIKNMVASGIKHVFLERPYQMQNLVDDLAAGKITVDQFVEEHHKKLPVGWLNEADAKQLARNLGNAIVKLDAAGVKTHFVDDVTRLRNRLGPDGLKPFAEMQKGVREYHAQHANGRPFIFHSKLVLAYTFNNLAKKGAAAKADMQGLAKAGQVIMEERHNDTETAARIRAIAGGEKSAILYGAAHGFKENDLDNLLGRDKVVRVDLHGDKLVFSDKLMCLQRRNEEDPADFRHFIKEGQIYAYRPKP
jgi:hypothetical protein